MPAQDPNETALKIHPDREERAYDAAARVVNQAGEGENLTARTLQRAVHAALVEYETFLSGEQSNG